MQKDNAGAGSGEHSAVHNMGNDLMDNLGSEVLWSPCPGIHSYFGGHKGDLYSVRWFDVTLALMLLLFKYMV